MGGKKKKNRHQKQVSKESKGSRRVEKTIKSLISQLSILLQDQQRFEGEVKRNRKRTEQQKPRPETLEELEADLAQLRPLVARLQAAQSPMPGVVIDDSFEDRKQKFALFKTWMIERAPNCLLGTKYDFSIDVDEGCGVVALCDMKAEELFLRVPRSLAMSTDTCLNSPIGRIVSEDSMCLSMPSLSLALHVLFEKLNPQSLWAPYLNVLPPLARMTLPLLFPPSQLAALAGSPTLKETLQLQKSTIRQYVYLYKLLIGQKFLSTVPSFRYEDFVWAVAVVMTRQNQIPRRENFDQNVLALLPGFDFVNYRPGVMTTYFNQETDSSETLTMAPVATGDPVYMYYGDRPNSKLFLFSGFVAEDHQNDSTELVLSIPDDAKADPIVKIRKILLAKVGWGLEQGFRMPDCIVGSPEQQQQLMRFCRIAVMTRAEAGGALTGQGAGAPLSTDNEIRALEYLAAAIQQRLKTYPTEHKQSTPVDAADRLCTAMLISEVMIFSTVTNLIQGAIDGLRAA